MEWIGWTRASEQASKLQVRYTLNNIKHHNVIISHKPISNQRTTQESLSIAIMASAEELKKAIDAIAGKINDLKKASPVDKVAIGAAVKELLDAKRSYAGKNNGIGVDGKPWEEPLSKAEKKKRDKEMKSAANMNVVNVNSKPVSPCSNYMYGNVMIKNA